MSDSKDMPGLLGADGPFAREVPNFAPRESQQRMAEAVSAAMADGETLAVEAGTGTGKTFAYLLPALLSGRRVIVSTGTKTLQDQLYHRDLPRVRSVLGVGMKASLLKGRANYLCLYRMQQADADGRFSSRRQAHDLQAIRRWAKATRSGDRAEMAEVPEESPLWPRVTSTVENCLGSECPLFDDCFVVKARRAAQEADLVVVNHHLLFADLALKQEGFGEILPGAEAFILDEAHQLPELAGVFFSVTLSGRQLGELARDALAECEGLGGALDALQAPLDELDKVLRRLRLALDALPPRGSMALVENAPDADAEMEALEHALAALTEALAAQAERSRGMANVYERALAQVERLRRVLGSSDETEVRWYDVSPHGFTLNATPLDLAPPLRAMRERTGGAWIFTSATLAVAGSFAHFAQQMGLEDPRTLALESPFDFARQALAYLPEGLPNPGAPEYTAAVVQAALPVLAASRGRAFMLFTSHRALRIAADLLRERVDYPLFVQGTAPRHQLLMDFRASGNGVLLGAASFWSGVDVAGEALSCVIIDKLPFAAPGDPVLEARLEALRHEGHNPFTHWQVPNAVIALKQGSGRLIRSVTDCGVLMLCDPRLITRGYGRLFLASLPPLPRTCKLAEVQAFFAEDQPSAALAQGMRGG